MWQLCLVGTRMIVCACVVFFLLIYSVCVSVRVKIQAKQTKYILAVAFAFWWHVFVNLGLFFAWGTQNTILDYKTGAHLDGFSLFLEKLKFALENFRCVEIWRFVNRVNNALSQSLLIFREHERKNTITRFLLSPTLCICFCCCCCYIAYNYKANYHIQYRGILFLYFKCINLNRDSAQSELSIVSIRAEIRHSTECWADSTFKQRDERCRSRFRIPRLHANSVNI